MKKEPESFLERNHKRKPKKKTKPVEEKTKHEKAEPYTREQKSQLINALLGDWNANAE